MATDQDIEKAAAILRSGKLVAFPTETVYGLGADAGNAAAVRKIFALKGRPADHPVIVHIARADDINHWARDIPADAWRLAEQFWPGPLTLILKRAPSVSDLVTGGQDSVGLRVPGHPVAAKLLQVFGAGIAAPSANRFGRLSPTTAGHVREELGEAVDMILDAGACDIGIESTIVDLTRGSAVVLRPGKITAAQINAALSLTEGEFSESPVPGTAPRVSGLRASHYAPQTPVVVLHPDLIEEFVRRKAGVPVAVLARRSRPENTRTALWQVAPATADDYARVLYASLRRLDASGCRMIVIEDLPQVPEWVAVRDRITRAALGQEASVSSKIG